MGKYIHRREAAEKHGLLRVGIGAGYDEEMLGVFVVRTRQRGEEQKRVREVNRVPRESPAPMLENSGMIWIGQICQLSMSWKHN